VFVTSKDLFGPLSSSLYLYIWKFCPDCMFQYASVFVSLGRFSHAIHSALDFSLHHASLERQWYSILKQPVLVLG
jgi:hypothetical protein